MNLDDFSIDSIEIQKFQKDSNPLGVKFIKSGANPLTIDTMSKTHQDSQRHDRMTVPYAKLNYNQTLIGVYGSFDHDDEISNIGFIVKEKIELWNSKSKYLTD